MSNTITYTFHIESNDNLPTDSTPVFANFINVDDGVDMVSNSPSSLPTITSLGGNFFKFQYTWDGSSGEPEAYLVKINVGLMDTVYELLNSGQAAFITMRIERQDNLANVAKRIEDSATSLGVSSTAIDNLIKSLLDIEVGTWEIDGTTLKVKSAGVGSQTAGTLIAEYDLKDKNGTPTDTNPFTRELKSFSYNS